MVHEAMILEYAGPRLALVEWAAGMRLDRAACVAGKPVRAVGHCRQPARARSTSSSASPRWWPRSPCWRHRSPPSRCSSPNCGSSGCLNCWPDRFCSRCSRSPPPTSSGCRHDATNTFAVLVDLAAGGLILAAVLIVWRRDLTGDRSSAGLPRRCPCRHPHPARGLRRRWRARRRRCRRAAVAGRGAAAAAGPRGGRRAAIPPRGYPAGEHRHLAADRRRADAGRVRRHSPAGEPATGGLDQCGPGGHLRSSSSRCW